MIDENKLIKYLDRSYANFMQDSIDISKKPEERFESRNYARFCKKIMILVRKGRFS